MSYQSITVRPVAGSLGAEISGVDLAAPLSNTAAAEIRRAFVENLVLFFRDQRLTPEQHLAFSRLFGRLCRMPYIKHLDDHPDIIAVLKEADEAKISTFGNAWHSDFSFLEEPPLGSILYAREVPSHGGDTLFANMYEAYEALSSGMKRMLGGLRAMHSGRPYGRGGVPKDLKIAIDAGRHVHGQRRAGAHQAQNDQRHGEDLQTDRNVGAVPRRCCRSHPVRHRRQRVSSGGHRLRRGRILALPGPLC